MIDVLTTNWRQGDYRFQTLRATAVRWAWFACVTAVIGLVGLVLVRKGPDPAVVVWLVYFLGALAILVQPRTGLYLILFFALAADNVLLDWYPFVKNFSSQESILFLHNSLIVSPVEVYLALTFISWLGRWTAQRAPGFYQGPLLRPALVFFAFLIFGFIYGVGKGGSLNMALWEMRPFVYLIAMLVLVSNLVETRDHAIALAWTAMVALLVEGVIGSLFVLVELQGDLSGIQAITEHPTAIHMNTVFIFTLGAWLYRTSPARRMVLMLFSLVVAIPYIATQRRAAFLALGVALFLLALILYRENRALFWIILPPALLLVLIYILVFWNNTGALGLPAQAVKAIIFPHRASASDQSSNLYRALENFNLSFTIHQRTLTGVGFGQKFYVVLPMPDISFFTWWDFLPHNSIFYIWLKGGVGAFFSMLFLVGTALAAGARTLLRMPRGDLKAIALTAVLYIVMHFTFAYVDISWEARSMLYLGAMLGLVNCLEQVAARPAPLLPRRWHWQADPEPVPEPVSLSSIK